MRSKNKNGYRGFQFLVFVFSNNKSNVYIFIALKRKTHTHTHTHTQEHTGQQKHHPTFARSAASLDTLFNRSLTALTLIELRATLDEEGGGGGGPNGRGGIESVRDASVWVED